MSDFELSEERGWGVYGQNPYTGKWRLDGAARSKMMAYTYAGESQRVEEVTIRPVSLGADPVQWAAVQMAMALFASLRDHQAAEYAASVFGPAVYPSVRFTRSLQHHVHLLFGGSLGREP